MRLEPIRQLVEKGAYQYALIESISYIFFGLQLKSIWDFNIPYLERQLENKLRHGAINALRNESDGGDVNSDGDITLNLDLDLLSGLENGDSNKQTWWRLDFVCSSNSYHINGNIRLPLSKDASSVMTIPFLNGELSTAIFPSHHSATLKESYDGQVVFDSNSVSYSLCQLNSRQVISQLLKLFRLTDLDWTRETFHLPSHLEGLLGQISSGDIDSYVRDHLGFKALVKSSDKELDYSYFYKKSLTNVLLAECPSLKSRAVYFDDIDTVEKVVNKSKLGKKISWNIEGVKLFSGLMVVHGWIFDPLHEIQSMTIFLNGGSLSYQVLPNMLMFKRADVTRAFAHESPTDQTCYGFLSTLDLPALKITQKVSISILSKTGKIFSEDLVISNVNSDMSELSSMVGIIPNREITAEACNKFYKPLFNALIQGMPSPKILLDKTVPETIGESLGAPAPKLSVIIPLYGDTRFELTQIPQLAALHRSDWEIIFAIDDPKILTATEKNIERLASNYGLPIRIIAADRNIGFSGINNLAASRANADTLLFLNSDCFITTPRPIIDAFEWLNDPAHGAVGFRLFYPDQTLQHDGMSVSLWNNDQNFYLNLHPRSGIATEELPYFIEDDSARLLTGACLMLKKQLFEELGGFDTAYLRGDFEDSDLCLKVISKGKKLGIVRQAGIYHLERQSIGAQSDGLRQLITLVNSNIYSERWKKILLKGLPALELIQ